LDKNCSDEELLHADTNDDCPGDEKLMPHEEIAVLLLTSSKGDCVVALGELYAEVRRKYPGEKAHKR